MLAPLHSNTPGWWPVNQPSMFLNAVPLVGPLSSVRGGGNVEVCPSAGVGLFPLRGGAFRRVQRASR